MNATNWTTEAASSYSLCHAPPGTPPRPARHTRFILVDMAARCLRPAPCHDANLSVVWSAAPNNIAHHLCHDNPPICPHPSPSATQEDQHAADRPAEKGEGGVQHTQGHTMHRGNHHRISRSTGHVTEVMRAEPAPTTPPPSPRLSPRLPDPWTHSFLTHFWGHFGDPHPLCCRPLSTSLPRHQGKEKSFSSQQ